MRRTTFITSTNPIRTRTIASKNVHRHAGFIEQSQAHERGYAPEQFYLRSAREDESAFPAETPEAVTNTLSGAEKCNLEIQFGKLHFPVSIRRNISRAKVFLRQWLAEGLFRRYTIHAKAEGKEFVVEGIDDPPRLPTFKTTEDTKFNLDDPVVAEAIKTVLDRLKVEIAVIEKTGFISYFLIVGDFIRKGREMGVTCVARGSAAGSLVTYLLEIANVDPIRYGLLFERFLNPERISPPDIDIDFADDRRADVIEYVRQKYGRDSVAQIITFGTMGAKSVVRDVGRVMGLPYGDCDRLAKMIPFDLKMTLEKALKQSPEFKQAYETEEVTRELVDTALILEDLTRNASVHAAGVVIGPEPLVNFLPLKQDEDGSLVTQYAMNPVGDLGLLEDGFSRTKNVDRHPQHLRKWSGAQRELKLTLINCRSTIKKPTTCLIARKRLACFNWNRAGCATFAKNSRSVPSNTSPRSLRCIVPARWNSSRNSSSAGTVK